jgi:predicted nucleic acid-binding protein
MSIALDTNVLQAILQEGHPLQQRAFEVLSTLDPRQRFILCPIVYAEAHGIPNFETTMFERFLQELGVTVDWHLPEEMWTWAGVAQVEYHTRRRKQGLREPKRLLADFLVGAHALARSASLLTFDPTGYRAAFPKLELLPKESEG